MPYIQAIASLRFYMPEDPQTAATFCVIIHMDLFEILIKLFASIQNR